MPHKKENKLTREEILEKQRKAERLRYERLKNDLQKREEMREKEHQMYLKKKEKGVRKLVKDMNPREHRAEKETWKEHCANYRTKKRTLKEVTNTFIRENTPESEREHIPPRISSASGKRRRRRAKRLREKQIKEKDVKIAELRKKVEKYKKRLQKLEKAKEKVNVDTPKTKLLKLFNTPKMRKEVVKKALFGEVINEQLKENYCKLKSNE